MSGRKSGVDFRCSCSRCRASDLVSDGCRDPRRKSAPGKCFRYGLATQDLVSHDVHGLRTAIATEGWPPIYTILAGSVGVAEAAEMGGARSSVAGENR